MLLEIWLKVLLLFFFLNLMSNLWALWCSWGHTTWFSTLSCHARHNCANSNCSCSPNGIMGGGNVSIDQSNILIETINFWCGVIFRRTSDNLIEAALSPSLKIFYIKKWGKTKSPYFAGWEGRSYLDTTLCGWNQHITAISVWNSIACCN